MQDLSLQTVVPTVNCEYIRSWVYVVESKIFTPVVKHIDILIFFLKGIFDNGLFIRKYEKSNFMPADVCTKTCLGPIIIKNNKLMTGFKLYLTEYMIVYRTRVLHY